MVEYALVIDEQVSEVRTTLPKSWKHVSNFNALANKPQILSNLGWYVVRSEIPSFDTQTHDLTNISYTFDGTGVVKTGVVVEKVVDVEQQRAGFLDALRYDRDVKLAASDWTQLQDVRNAKSLEWGAAWDAYRSQLRDLPTAYSDLSSYDNVTIVWPEVPNVIS